MRIAMATATSRRAGGVETYVEQVLASLASSGHEVALWAESDQPAAAPAIALPPGAPTVLIAAGTDEARAWKPDAVIVNGLHDVALEASLLAGTPSVFVAHNFYGTCISGTKSWATPVPRPCHRVFGAACLVHYFPHRCGGLSPVTMARLYSRERDRLRHIRAAQAVVTLSAFMREEYLRHGLDPTRVTTLPYGPPLRDAPGTSRDAQTPAGPRRLIAIARLEPIKGIHLLLDALPLVRASLGRAIDLTVLGDGSERGRLEAQAAEIAADTHGVTVRFAGWASPEDRDRHLRGADLLVVPSTWPEPLGLVGIEAARAGVPAAAFAVGGIGEWLKDGITGAVAPAEPPSAAGLADAIVSCLGDDGRLEALGRAARQHAARLTPDAHVAGLLKLLPRGRVNATPGLD